MSETIMDTPGLSAPRLGPLLYDSGIWTQVDDEIIRIYGRAFLEPAPGPMPRLNELTHAPACPCPPCSACRPPGYSAPPS